MSDFKPIGNGEPSDPFIGSPESKSRRWKIDWDASGKAYDKITHPTKSSKILPYSKFYTEIVQPANRENVSKQKLKMGIKSEMEHTNSVKEAAKIALTHLAENPHYYSKLKAVGLYEVLSSTVAADVLNADSKGCGASEFMKFFQIADEPEIKTVSDLLDSGDSNKILQAFQIVINVLRSAGQLHLYKLEEHDIQYKDFYTEILKEKEDLVVNKMDHTIDDDHTKDCNGARRNGSRIAIG